VRAGTPLEKDTLVKKGVTVDPAGPILAGTVLAANQRLDVTVLPAGTVIPRGSYTIGATGFPADGMSMTSGGTTMAGYDVQATFATIEDFQRAVREAGVYVDVAINERGTGLEFTSTLAGAWLTVSEDTDCYEQMGDRNQQLTSLNLTGLVKGLNSDDEGNAFTEVIYYPPDPLHPGEKIKLHDKSGNIIELDPGYYVRVYSDASQLDVPYEDRDNTTMTAEGFIPAGDWDPAFLPNKEALEAAEILAYEAHLATLDATPGITPDDPRYLEPWVFNPGVDIFAGANLGIMQNLVLEERNNSGVSGTVNLDYHGPRPQTATLTYHVNSEGAREYTFDYSPDDNDGITVYPGGFRQMTGRHASVQEMDLYDPEAGVNCDANGTIHARISAEDPVTNLRVVELYRDGSHKVMTARSDPDAGIGPNGEVVLYNIDRDGNFLDKAGNVLDTTVYPLNQFGVVVGTMKVDVTNLPAGDAEDFTMVTGAARNTGQEREENVFSTLNDIIDAMVQDDVEALSNLVEDIQRDIDRALAAEGEVASRWDRLELLAERHGEDIINFSDIKTRRVGMNEEAEILATIDWQAAKNAVEASLQTTSQSMNLSLLNYL
jgi:flagellin-like hook-associated protein FlgL